MNCKHTIKIDQQEVLIKMTFEAQFFNNTRYICVHIWFYAQPIVNEDFFKNYLLFITLHK